MRDIKDCHLYGIVDLGYVRPEKVLAMTADLLAGGVDILQLRAKKYSAAEVETLALQILPLSRGAGVPLIINDFPEVAAKVGADGVHVGQDDLSIAQVRAIVGDSCIVGKSTHSLAQARAAIDEAIDYIGFGPLYATGTKPDYIPVGLQDIRAVHALATKPVFCIGGVNQERLPEILAAGAHRVVVVSAFLCAPNVPASVTQLKQSLNTP
jgi:thiamine-phosphate pyrophosphorylase